MNVGQIRTRIQTMVGDTSGAEVTAASILDWINDGIGEIARVTGQPQATGSTTVVSGQSTYSLPAAFPDILRLRSVKYDGSQLQALQLEEAETLYPGWERTGQGSGTPQQFWVWADSITVWPPPDNSTKQLKLYYTKRPAAVVLDADVPGIPVHMHTDLLDYVHARVLESLGQGDRAERGMDRTTGRVMAAAADAQWPVRNAYPHVQVAADDMGW